MSMISSIASASMSMSQARVEQAVNIAMMKKVMDMQEQQGQAIVDMLGAPAIFGRRLDVRA